MPTDNPTKAMAGVARNHASQGLILQTHAMTVDRQPIPDFSAYPKLKESGDSLASTLRRAQSNSAFYLKEIQPLAMNSLQRIDRYINVEVGIAKMLEHGADKNRIIQGLRAAEQQTLSFKGEADDVHRRLDTLRQSLSADGAEFQRHKQTLLTLTEADGGVLKSLEGQIADIDGKMNGLIAGAVISGLAVIGGVFLVAIGSVAGFVTAGTSVPLALLGGTIVVGGIAGEVGSSIAIAGLSNQKSELMRQQTGLRSEVVFAQGLASTLTTLSDGAANSALAAQQMSNAWNTLGGHLQNLAQDLEAGRAEIDDLLDLFLAAAEGDIADLKRDTRVIQDQLAGAASPIANENAPLADVVATAQARADEIAKRAA